MAAVESFGGRAVMTSSDHASGTDRVAEVAHDLDADVKATGIGAQGKKFGDLSLTANSSAGRVNFVLDSNLADDFWTIRTVQ